jgi:hypothetical protein
MMNVRRLCLVLLVVSVLVITCIPASAIFGEPISVSGLQFNAGANRIWINGANTPWNSWNDFGGNFNYSWWDTHFATLHANGINATRVWITCDGTVGININNTTGYVSGATAAHWSNLDSLFQIAQNQQVYIDATLISFDHFKRGNRNNRGWRKMLTDPASTDSFVNNYVIPFVNRYKNNPYLWTIDLCNEPDWVYENSECGQIPWDNIQTYFAKAAVGIHANSNIPVHVGMAMIKYCSSVCEGAMGNKVSDAALQAKVNDPQAKVDFDCIHTYSWMEQYWGIPFYQTPVGYGLDGIKPAIIGECPAVGSTGHTTTQDYENAYLNGWQGAMAWTSNGVDSNGSLVELGPATNAFRDNHYSLVFP